MSTLLEPTLSNIFMSFIEKKAISEYKITCSDMFKIDFLGKKQKEIDELFSVFKKTSEKCIRKKNNDALSGANPVEH